MSTLFVSRHPGASDWLARQGHAVDRSVDELTAATLATLGPGDIVIGTLPVALAAAVCARGAQYLNLVIPSVPRELRGQELDADMLERLGARLQGFGVWPAEAAPRSGGQDVLVVPRCALAALPAAAVWPWHAPAVPPAWLPRAQAETEEQYLQLVPYLLLLDETGAPWCYRRRGGDARVRGRLSCGLGGHVERADAAAALPDTLMRALRRELVEELGADAAGIGAHGPLGWVYEHESAIGRVHLGVLYAARWPYGRAPQPAEVALHAEGFRPLAELATDPELELWSRLAAGFLLAHPEMTAALR